LDIFDLYHLDIVAEAVILGIGRAQMILASIVPIGVKDAAIGASDSQVDDVFQFVEDTDDGPREALVKRQCERVALPRDASLAGIIIEDPWTHLPFEAVRSGHRDESSAGMTSSSYYSLSTTHELSLEHLSLETALSQMSCFADTCCWQMYVRKKRHGEAAVYTCTWAYR